MPDPETDDRYQAAVLWAKTGVDRHGEVTVAEPEQLLVRWQTGQAEALAPDGTPIALDAKVVLDRRVGIGSLLLLGELDDWYGTGSVGDDVELMQVATYSEVPDLKNRVARRTVGLVKYRGALP